MKSEKEEHWGKLRALPSGACLPMGPKQPDDGHHQRQGRSGDVIKYCCVQSGLQTLRRGRHDGVQHDAVPWARAKHLVYPGN